MSRLAEQVSTRLDPREWAFRAANAPDTRSAFNDLYRVLTDFGFPNVNFFHDAPPDNPSLPAIREIYGYVVDPKLREFLDSQKPLDVITQCFASGGRMVLGTGIGYKYAREQSQVKQLEAIADAGVTAAAFFGVNDRKRGLASLLSVEWHDAPSEFRDRLNGLDDQMHALAIYFNEGLTVRKLVQSKNGKPLLNARERECMSWITAGKSTKEIGDMLNLADCTVNEYITSATRKLKATNRTQAAARAMLAGLVQA